MSPTWDAIVDSVQREVNDTAATMHTDSTVRRYAEWGESLLSIRRGLYEWTVSVQLQAGVPVYTIHSSTPTPALSTALPLFIRPLRIALNKVPLRPTSLATLSRATAKWWQERGTPESYFMIGGTLIGFFPVPAGTTTVEITFLCTTPTTTTTPPPAVGTSPVVADEWQTDLSRFAESICLAKGGEITKATEKLQEFLNAIGIKRDVRFLSGSAVKTPETIQAPISRTGD